MTELLIENNQEKVEIDSEIQETINKACEKTLEYENCSFDAQISVTIVDNEEIQRINKEFRNKDAVTDVLSFPMLEFDEDGNAEDCDFDFDGEEAVLGDIVISAERAAEQAKSYGHSFKREIAFLTVHSMLHLLGYDHETSPLDERIMREKEEAVLEKLGISRDATFITENH